jgi:hypothetical protein
MVAETIVSETLLSLDSLGVPMGVFTFRDLLVDALASSVGVLVPLADSDDVLNVSVEDSEIVSVIVSVLDLLCVPIKVADSVVDIELVLLAVVVCFSEIVSELEHVADLLAVSELSLSIKRQDSSCHSLHRHVFHINNP